MPDGYGGPPPVPEPLPELPPELRLRPTFTRPLSLLNPLDYLRLLYWAFFKPQAIREYIGWIAPDAAEVTGARAIWKAVRANAGLQLFMLQALLIQTLLPLLVAFSLQTAGVNVGWTGVAFSVVFGMAVGVVFGVVVGVAFGVAFGVAVGVAFGVGVGVAFGVGVGVALGVALGVAVGVAVGVARGVAGGVAVGVAFGMASGVAGGVAFGVAGGVAVGVAFGVAFGVMMLRLPFYLVAAPLGASIHHPNRLWPARLDGMNWLPLPGLRTEIVQIFQRDIALGVALCSEILDHSLQFIPTVQAVNEYFEHPDNANRLHIYARFAFRHRQPGLVEYISRDLAVALRNNFWRGLFIWLSRRFQPGWLQTPPLRQDTPIRLTCAAYSTVWSQSGRYGIEKLQPEVLTSVAADYAKFLEWAYAAETAWIYRMMGMMLGTTTPDRIAALNLPPFPEPDNPGDILRPEVVYALNELTEVVREVKLANNATAASTGLQALARGLDRLRLLKIYVGEHTFRPERPILLRIIETWEEQLTIRGGELGREEVISVIPNNYIVGPALRGQGGRLFVGRQDVYARIVRLWSNQQIKPPILLWGQRRIGKTSILLHLAENLPPEYLPVFVDLQGVGAVNSLGGLFYNVTRSIERDLAQHGIAYPAPDFRQFGGEPFIVFDRYLDGLEQAIPRCSWLVLMFDEFEKIEEKLRTHVFPQDLLEYLRNVMQHRPWLALILSGSHVLEELRHEFWSPLMDIAHVERVGYLDDPDALRLVTNPWPDFPLNYDPPQETPQYIVRQCGGQPLLLQAVGYQVVERLNQRLARGGAQVRPLAEMEDARLAVEHVIGHNEYFAALYNSLSNPARGLLSHVAAHQERTNGWVDLADLGVYNHKAFQELERRQVIQVKNERVRLRVEMLRRWLRRDRAAGGH